MELLKDSDLMENSVMSNEVLGKLKKSNIKGLRVSGGGIAKIIKKALPIEDDEEEAVHNENIYKDRILEQIEKLNNLKQEVKENVNREYKIYNELAEISKSTNATPNVPKYTSAQLLGTNKVYQNIVNKTNEANLELDKLEVTYKQLDNLTKNIDILEKNYSMSTESVYLIIPKNALITLVNNVSKADSKMIILSEDILKKNTIKVRFSNHIPNYYKCNESISGYKEHRDVNVLVMYNELVKEIKENSNIAKKKENVTKDIDRAKHFSSMKMDNLTEDELQEYYDISNKLLNNKDLSGNKFVISLKTSLIGLERRLSLK